MSRQIIIRPLSAKSFAKYGDVIQKEGAHNYPINKGTCTRFHDLAIIETIGSHARPLISIFSAAPSELPLELTMVERHPLGSQAFIPLSDNPFLVVVCGDKNGTPTEPEAFITAPKQGINFRRNVWHGVLTPLVEASDFLVVDRGGDGNNLDEYYFSEPFEIVRE